MGVGEFGQRGGAFVAQPTSSRSSCASNQAAIRSQYQAVSSQTKTRITASHVRERGEIGRIVDEHQPVGQADEFKHGVDRAGATHDREAEAALTRATVEA
jgi:hypothetical protein